MPPKNGLEGQILLLSLAAEEALRADDFETARTLLDQRGQALACLGESRDEAVMDRIRTASARIEGTLTKRAAGLLGEIKEAKRAGAAVAAYSRARRKPLL